MKVQLTQEKGRKGEEGVEWLENNLSHPEEKKELKIKSKRRKSFSLSAINKKGTCKSRQTDTPLPLLDKGGAKGGEK